MKTNTFRLFTIIALMLSMSCSVDTIQEDYETTNLERTDGSEMNSEKQNDGKSKDESTNQQRQGDPLNTNNSNQIIFSEIPNGTHIHTLYLNMDLIETGYQGSFTGSFSEHYRNEMMNHFTVFSIEYSVNQICDNIERWIINSHEYNSYLVMTGNAGSVNLKCCTVGNTGGGNSSSTSGGSVNGGGKGSTLPPPPVPDGDVDYSYCFGTGLIFVD